MTGEVEYDRLSKHFPELISQVVEHGLELESRAGKVKEVVGLVLRLWEPRHCIVGRDGFSKDFMRMEILQLLAGLYDKELLAAHIPRAAEMIQPATAYGPRVYYQMEVVEQELRANPESRRAVVYVGREKDLAAMHDRDESARRAGEMPCTCTWQFLVRYDKLHMVVTMRSWDLVWGLSYDVPCFVSVQMALAQALGIETGMYQHVTGSAHVYDRHWEIPAWDNEEDGLLVVEPLMPTYALTAEACRKVLDNDREALKAAA